MVLRQGVATVINRHLELQGHLDRVSHLSHKLRGIELLPSIHEGAARHMSSAERRLLNDAILAKNAAAIRGNPELVFQKLSINKPVFTKEDIATALSDALYRDMEIEAESAGGNSRSGRASDGESDNGHICTESLGAQYANEFLVAYENLLKSSEIKLVNPCDLRGRTLYALTKRLELEARFISTVEELGSGSNHNIRISAADIEKHSVGEIIDSKLKELGNVVGAAIGLSAGSASRAYINYAFTEEQKAAIVSIVNGQDISLLEGFPRSGKTATMREIVRQYRRAGYRVIGTATSASAAEVLGMEAGIESKNISRLRKEWQEHKNNVIEPGSKYAFELALRADYYKEDQYREFGVSLTNKDVLIIDEASIVTNGYKMIQSNGIKVIQQEVVYSLLKREVMTNVSIGASYGDKDFGSARQEPEADSFRGWSVS